MWHMTHQADVFSSANEEVHFSMEQASGVTCPCKKFATRCRREVEGSREEMIPLLKSYKAICKT